MPLCTICAHPKRKQIEAELLAGKSLRDIAKQSVTNYGAVNRHKKKCMGAAVAVAAERRKVDFGSKAIDCMDESIEYFKVVYLKALGDGKYSDAIAALDKRNETAINGCTFQGLLEKQSSAREKPGVTAGPMRPTLVTTSSTAHSLANSPSTTTGTDSRASAGQSEAANRLH